MNCNDAQLKLADLVVDRLDDADRFPVEAHLATCEGCREFRDDIGMLYAIESANEIEVPQPALVGVAPPPRRAAAGLFILLGFLGAAFALTFNVPGEPRREYTWADLPDLGVTWPDLPSEIYPTGWQKSPEVARLYSEFTGKPLLEQHVLTICPRCEYMEEVLQEPTVVERLDGFILLRTEVTARLETSPAWIREALPRDREPFMLPGIRISDEACQTDPIFEVGSPASVYELMDRYRKDCGADSRTPLEAYTYNQLLRSFEEVGDLLRESEYGRAHAELEEVVSVGSAHRTAFVERARSLASDLEEGLARQARALEAELTGSEHRPASVRRVAAALARSTEGLEVSARFSRLAGGR